MLMETSEAHGIGNGKCFLHIYAHLCTFMHIYALIFACVLVRGGSWGDEAQVADVKLAVPRCCVSSSQLSMDGQARFWLKC